MSSSSKATLKTLVKDAEKACVNGLFKEAEDLYTNAIELEPSNPILYGNRSAARIQQKEYDDALDDAERALRLDHNYPMGYFRQGVALQSLGDFAKSIVAFSDGVVRDQKSPQFVAAMIDVALKSPIRVSLEPVISQLLKMRLENNPFIVTSVIGQELLAHNHTEDAVLVLENAVAIGSRSLKLQGSVFSALSSALWSLGDTEKAIHYMKEDLKVSRLLTDNSGECRAHGNLGAAFYSQGDFQAAKENHNRQLALAQNMQDEKAMASAFSSLGHIHMALNDHKSAAESHKQSASILRNSKDITGWCRELGLVADAYVALGDLDSGLQWQLECLRVTTDEFETGSQEGACEEAKARVDLAAVYHRMQKFTEEISCLQKSVDISRNINDSNAEAQTLTSLGYITRQTGDLEKAQVTYERLLELALTASDWSMEARACANLGVIHHQRGDFEMALKLQARNLDLSIEFQEVGAQGRAHGNIGNAYSAMGMYEQAIQHHLKELEISHSSDDKASECSTHGNLAVAYQALGDSERAFHHYRCQSAIANEIGDVVNESRAYMNLANFHSSRKEYRAAIEIYTKYLAATENCGVEKPSGTAKACYNIGFAHFSLHEYADAISFYEQSLKISLENDETVGAARAYCNLGLAWKALGDKSKALECQNLFLSLSNQLQSARGVFKALGNLGDIYISQRQPTEAISFYQQQLELAKQSNDALLVAQACAALGAAYRLIGDYQKSLELHSQEVEIYQGGTDSKNEFKAHGHLGAVLTSLGEFSSAAKCYENQCYIANQIADSSLQIIALGNMGITLINAQEYEKAIEFFERQLVAIEASTDSNLEKGKILCNIGDCYEALERFDDAISTFTESLQVVLDTNHAPSLERAYRGLSSTCKLLNKPKEAFEYSRLRLQACQQMQDTGLLAETYGDMGYLFTVLADFKHAMSCLKLQMKFAENLPQMRGDAACGLGTVCQIMKNYKSALEYHQLDLKIALETKNVPCQGRAHGNLGTAFESLHEHLMAVQHQEQHLFIADNLNDALAKLTALRGIARNILRLGSNHQRASLLLQQALLLARELGMKEDEGKVTLDLGLALWVCGDMNNAEAHLLKATEIIATEFWKSGVLGSSTDISVHPNLSIELFEELVTCHSALTAFYVITDRHTMALGAAERLRTLPELVAKKRTRKKHQDIARLGDLHVVAEQLVKHSKEKDSVVLYYTICGGYVLMWVITPEEGLCGFVRHPLFYENAESNDLTNDVGEAKVKNWKNMLTHLIADLRDSLGVESPSVEVDDPADETESPGSLSEDDVINYIEQNGICDMNADNFLVFSRIIESHLEMKYSKNLAVMGLLGPSNTIYPKKAPIYALHDLLIEGLQDKLQKYASQSPMKNLVLVVEGELFSVPFPLLKRRATDLYLSQQFVLQTISSANQLMHDSKITSQSSPDEFTRAVVIGNPILSDVFNVPPSQASEDEANLVGSMLKIEPLVGKTATKGNVLSAVEHAECLHLACNISMQKPYGIRLSSAKPLESKTLIPAAEIPSGSASNADSGIGKETSNQTAEDQIDDLENDEGHDLTPSEVAQRSLTLSKVMTLDMSSSKLVVFGSAHLQDVNQSDDDGEFQHKSPKEKLLQVSLLTQTFTTAGAQAILLSLWPVPETACKLLIQSFYSRLLSGIRASDALRQSVNVLRGSEQFEHPSYWAGFVLIGQDVTLDPQNLALNHALALMIRSDPSRFHDTLRLVLHLMDKSLERIDSNINTTVPMYTAQVSISKKVQNVTGWRELFSAVGFELRQSSNGLPDAVFFPTAEKRDEIEAIKPELISLLQVSAPVLTGLNLFFTAPQTASDLIASLQTCLEEHSSRDRVNDGYDNIEQLVLITSQKTWRAHGCSEILRELGFNVSQIGEENVMLHNTPEALPLVENILRLMMMLFSGKQCLESEMELPFDFDRQSENSRTESCLTPLGSQISNFVTRGLPPTSRRSIAVDFNASFKSQSSSGSSFRAELPEHMAEPPPTPQGTVEVAAFPGEPKKFSLVPSSDSIIAPKPIFPPTNIPKLNGLGNPPLRKSVDDNNGRNGLTGTTQQDLKDPNAPKRMKPLFLNTPGADTLDNKLPKSPRRSPMFYRKTENLKHEEATSSQGCEHLVPDPSGSAHTTHLPTSAGLASRGQGVALHTAHGATVTGSGAVNGSQVTSPYVPAPSVARSLSLSLNSCEYTSIVDKLKRLSVSDLVDGPQARSNVKGDLKDGESGRDGNNNTLNQSGTTWHGSDIRGTRSGAAGHQQDYGQKPTYHEGAYGGSPFAPRNGLNSPHNGALHINLPYHSSSYPQPLQDGSHMHSLLDTVAKRRSSQNVAHKYTLSQDRVLPPPYKHPDIVTSPRRSSGETSHSRAGSHASQSSISSNKSAKKEPHGKQPRRKKGHTRVAKSQKNPQDSFSGSECSQVSYQLETGNEGKTWFINENFETTDHPHEDLLNYKHQVPTSINPASDPSSTQPVTQTHNNTVPQPQYYHLHSKSNQRQFKPVSTDQEGKPSTGYNQFKPVTTNQPMLFYQQSDARPQQQNSSSHFHQQSWPVLTSTSQPQTGASASMENLGQTPPPVLNLARRQPAITRIKDAPAESAVFYQKSDKNRQISPRLMANFLDSPSMTPPLLSPTPVKPNVPLTAPGSSGVQQRPDFQNVHFKPLRPPTPTHAQQARQATRGKQPLTYGLQAKQQQNVTSNVEDDEEEIAFV